MPRKRTLDPAASPQHFFGAEVRRAREAAGMSQVELGKLARCDDSYVSRVEGGLEDPPKGFTEACDEAFPEMHGFFTRFLHDFRQWDGPIPKWFEAWLTAEGAAAILRYWSPLIIPALFHTDGYARALFLTSQTDISDDAIDALVAARLARAAILDRADPPEVVAIIDESVLHRLVGSPETMREQLEHIARLATRPNICVQVVPASVGATAGLSGDINLATVDGSADVLHTDAVPEGNTTEASTPDGRSRVRAAAVAFERIRQHALPHAQSIELIQKVERWNT
jgi:hypothetical protein